MLSATPALISLLASGAPLVLLELLTITLVGGGVLRYNNSPVQQAWQGQVYEPLIWERGEINLVLGMEVDHLSLTIHPRIYPVSARSEAEEDRIGGIPWITAVQRGLLYGATIQLDQAYLGEQSPEIVGILSPFSGTVADPSYEEGLKLVIKSDLEVLNRPLPALLYQPGCPWTLYDASCGLNKAAWAVNGAATSGSGLNDIACNLSQADGYFDRGVIEFTSGANSGQRRTIKSYTTGQVSVVKALLAAPASGDTFIAWPGCPRTESACRTKFANFLPDGVTPRHGGHPNIPKPETTL